MLLLFLAFFTKAQNNWVKLNLDEKVYVNLPAMPEKKVGNGSISYTLKTKDSIVLSVAILDYKIIANLDSTRLATIKDNPDFANQLKQGLITQRPSYTFGNMMIGKWKTFSKFDINGVRKRDQGKLKMEMILIGSKLYGLSYILPDKFVSNIGDLFINSFDFIKP